MGAGAADSPVVMLVEDFNDTREILRRMAELMGCRVLEAANGQQAIPIAECGLRIRKRLETALESRPSRG